MLGFERFEGSIDGHEGSCVFQHIGEQGVCISQIISEPGNAGFSSHPCDFR
ncbi:MAG: hypothetical protein ABS879_03955 [Eubacteriales bacterium]